MALISPVPGHCLLVAFVLKHIDWQILALDIHKRNEVLDISIFNIHVWQVLPSARRITNDSLSNLIAKGKALCFDKIR